MQWQRLDPDDKSGATNLLLDGFKPANPAREADTSMADWLRVKAPHADFSVWLLVDGIQKIAAYHTAELASCKLRNGELVLSLNMRFAARDAEYSGAGKEIVDHLMALARASEKDIEHVTLDPFDDDVTSAWERYGFRDSLTRAQEDDDNPCFRMVRPVGGATA